MHRLSDLFTRKFGFAAILIVFSQTSLLAEEKNILNNCAMPPSEKPDSPWDYRTRKDRLELVENRHFTRPVELLLRGESTANLAADIAYTLRMFPNHHRALASLVRYSENKKQSIFSGMNFSVECYLQRAVNFKPDDLQARIIYASFLAKNKRLEQARKQLEYIEDDQNKTSTTNYNLGLIYLEIGDHEKSLHYAHKAYSESFPLAGLKNKLTRIGKWKDIRTETKTPPDNEASTITPNISSE